MKSGWGKGKSWDVITGSSSKQKCFMKSILLLLHVRVVGISFISQSNERMIMLIFVISCNFSSFLFVCSDMPCDIFLLLSETRSWFIFFVTCTYFFIPSVLSHFCNLLRVRLLPKYIHLHYQHLKSIFNPSCSIHFHAFVFFLYSHEDRHTCTLFKKPFTFTCSFFFFLARLAKNRIRKSTQRIILIHHNLLNQILNTDKANQITTPIILNNW